MRLELGSGYSPTPGYYHVDLNPNVPDLDRLAPAYPLEWCSHAVVDEIRAVDVLEHISYWLTRSVLHEWARVLKSDGRLYVQVPDAAKLMSWYVTGGQAGRSRLVRGMPPGLPQTPLAGLTWRLLGGHGDGNYSRDGDDWRLNAHYALFTPRSLADALTAAGFVVESMETNGHPNLLCWARKP